MCREVVAAQKQREETEERCRALEEVAARLADQVCECVHLFVCVERRLWWQKQREETEVRCRALEEVAVCITDQERISEGG